MTPKALVFQDDPSRVLGHACPECGRFYTTAMFGGDTPSSLTSTEDTALRCCNRVCQRCHLELPKKKYSYIYCKECLCAVEAEQEKEQFDRAEKIQESAYTGWVSWEEMGDNNGYFESIEEVREFCEDTDKAYPKYVYACREITGIKLNADDVIESEMDERHEDAIDDFDVSGLQKLLDSWCSEQNSVSYFTDEKRVVILDPAHVRPEYAILDPSTTSP